MAQHRDIDGGSRRRSDNCHPITSGRSTMFLRFSVYLLYLSAMLLGVAMRSVVTVAAVTAAGSTFTDGSISSSWMLAHSNSKSSMASASLSSSASTDMLLLSVRVMSIGLTETGRTELLLAIPQSTVATLTAHGIHQLQRTVEALAASGALASAAAASAAFTSNHAENTKSDLSHKHHTLAILEALQQLAQSAPEKVNESAAPHTLNVKTAYRSSTTLDAAASIGASHDQVHDLNEFPSSASRLYLIVELTSPTHDETGDTTFAKSKTDSVSSAGTFKGFADPQLRGRMLSPAEFLAAAKINRPSMLSTSHFGATAGKQRASASVSSVAGSSVSASSGPVDLSVGIVGGGASGLSNAFFLLQNNFVLGDHITIYESTNRTGGKIQSWQIEGNWYEKGAAHLLNFYDTTFWMLHYFNITYDAVSAYTLKGFTTEQLLQFLPDTLPMALDLIFYLSIIDEAQFTSYYTTASLAQMSENSDLRLSVDGFLAKYLMQPLQPFLDMMAYTLTSVAGADLPFGIFLRLFPPSALKAFISYNFVAYLNLKPFFPQVEPPSYFVPTGYQTLMDAVTNYLVKQGVKIVYDHKVNAINTQNPNLPVLTLINSQNQISQAAHNIVVFSTLYNSTDANFEPIFIAGVPALSVLQPAAPQVANPAIYKYHVRSNIGNQTGDFLFVNSAGQVNTPYSVYNFANSNILATLSVLTPGTAVATLKQNLVSALEGAGFGNITFLTAEQDSGYLCEVQPIPSVQLSQNGYYNQLEALQGVSNVFYTNIHYTISYSGLVMQYAMEVAQIITNRTYTIPTQTNSGVPLDSSPQMVLSHSSTPPTTEYAMLLAALSCAILFAQSARTL